MGGGMEWGERMGGQEFDCGVVGGGTSMGGGMEWGERMGGGIGV